MIEWRTVIFIRHGKSKWNAAESNALGKVVAAGQGLWEYYKHKKLRQNNVKKQKSEIDIMDAPLSREGIMESLNLCSHLREYTTSNQLDAYNALFEQTRTQIDQLLSSINTTTQTEEIGPQLQQCLAQLDEYKIKSLIAQHPPQDDDQLKLPQPVPERRLRQTLTSMQSSNELLGNNQEIAEEAKEQQQQKLNDHLDKLMNVSANSSVSNEPLETNTQTAENNANDIQTETPVISAKSSNEYPAANTNKPTKRYMSQISDPQSPMSAEYVINILNGNENKCGIVVSNLRRAMSTACICLKDRLERRPC